MRGATGRIPYLPTNGYVVIADPAEKHIRFASPSPDASYQWGRHTPLPAQHQLWRAHATGSYRGQGEVVWASGSRMNLWLDAVADGHLVHAVFSETRYWGGKGLSVLDQPPAPARPTAMSGTCRHCGADTWGYTACPTCGDVRCPVCGRCGCGAPASTTRVCSVCHLERGKGPVSLSGLEGLPRLRVTTTTFGPRRPDDRGRVRPQRRRRDGPRPHRVRGRER